ncbi:MAG: polysaccharide biosynthesis tyrosine autokinase [Bacteroidales bacterium]|jgi:capsular exopolysaccharide synthesis family protein|nr:polysaccharide biosynthesis tyrosine autokinase [Bacteroidales bacterium]
MENNNSGNNEYHQPFFPGDESIDFKRYLSLFISNWYWFAIFLFIAFTIAYGINRYSEEVYNVSSSILIKDELISGFTGMEPIFPGMDAYKNRQNLLNEIGILKSFSLNRMVIDSLPERHVEYTMIGRRGIAESRQYKSTPFIVIPDSSGYRPPWEFSVWTYDDSFAIALKGNPEPGERWSYGSVITDSILTPGTDQPYSFIIRERDDRSLVPEVTISNRYYFGFPSLDALANKYRSKLQVSPIEENATLVTLSVNGEVAEQEIDYLNTLMGLYINYGLKSKNETARLTIEFIEGQIEDIGEDLYDTEDDLQNFRLRNKLIDISSEGALIKSRLEKLGNDLTTTELQIQYFHYLREYLQLRNETGDIVSPSILGVNDPLLERLVGDLSSLQQQKMQLSMNLASDLAVIRILDEKIGNVKTALADNISNSLDNAGRTAEDLRGRIREVETELEQLPETEKELIRIQRTLDLNNTVYTYLLEKKAEAEIAKASNVPDNKPIDYAGQHSIVTVRPRQARNNLIALILGMVVPAIAIFMIDYLNNRVIDKRDVERYTNTPVLGYISHSDFKTETPVITRPGSTLAESFRSVRTALKFYTNDIKSPIIAISSTVSAEGKTFISVNLAIITASLGKKVLVVGLDLRKPKIHKILGADNSTGMSNFLSGGAAIDEVIQDTQVSNLWYAPAGPVPPNPAELIESPRMKEFLDMARGKFDYIFIDTPPVAIVTDALLLAPYVDVNIFVVRQRYTSRNTLNLIQEFYEGRKLRNLSVIINDISLSGYYGYGLRYGYSIRYGGYSYGYSFYGDYVYSKYGYGKEGKGYYTDDDEA